jgi:hypothetical protein
MKQEDFETNEAFEKRAIVAMRNSINSVLRKSRK